LASVAGVKAEAPGREKMGIVNRLQTGAPSARLQCPRPALDPSCPTLGI
jgi:hypothetical protein